MAPAEVSAVAGLPGASKSLYWWGEVLARWKSEQLLTMAGRESLAGVGGTVRLRREQYLGTSDSQSVCTLIEVRG